jgi:hypothetical protein
MALNPETLREIDGLVHGGSEERARFIEILCEEMDAPGELDESDVIATVDAALTGNDEMTNAVGPHRRGSPRLGWRLPAYRIESADRATTLSR